MRSKPLVSVIMPSYNHADYVELAVKSVLNQTIENIELIVIDDASTDGTPEKVNRIDDPRIRLFRLKQNRSKQIRNMGLEIAGGEFIAFQNSDDIWHPEKLEKQIRVLNLRRDLVACFTAVEVVDQNNQILENTWPCGAFKTTNRTNLNWLRYFFFKANCLCITSAVVRQSVIRKVGGFRGSLIQLSDFDLWIRLAALGNFYIIDEKLTSFRKTETGNLSQPSERNINRSIIEHANVLENYTEKRILKLTPEIFKNDIKTISTSTTTLKGNLVQLAWLKNSPHHQLFADRIMTSLLNDPSSRDDLTSTFGAEMIRTFYEKRGDIKIVLNK